MAPEIFESIPYSIKADVYSFGVSCNNIFYRSFYGKYVPGRLHINRLRIPMQS